MQGGENGSEMVCQPKSSVQTLAVRLRDPRFALKILCCRGISTPPGMDASDV